jgi:hypothetical protein
VDAHGELGLKKEPVMSSRKNKREGDPLDTYCPALTEGGMQGHHKWIIIWTETFIDLQDPLTEWDQSLMQCEYCKIERAQTSKRNYGLVGEILDRNIDVDFKILDIDEEDEKE